MRRDRPEPGTSGRKSSPLVVDGFAILATLLVVFTGLACRPPVPITSPSDPISETGRSEDQQESDDPSRDTARVGLAPPTRDSDDPQGKEPSSADPVLPVSHQPDWAELDNPAADGWDTEAVHESLSPPLHKLADLLHPGNSIDHEQLASLCTETFDATPVIPSDYITLFQDDIVEVRRGQMREASQSRVDLDQFREQLQTLVDGVPNANDHHVKFKTFRLQRVGPNEILTRQLLSHFAASPTQRREFHATWEMRWSLATGSPRIMAIDTIDFEEARASRSGAPWFADVTESALGQNACYRSQFLIGMNQWLERIQETRYFSTLGHPGIAVGDVNGDGRDDLYVCQETGLPNRLLLQNRDGTVTDASAEWGVDWLECTRSALLLDLDNDGDQDLVIATIGAAIVAENIDRKRYEIRAVLPTDDDTTSMCAADYDLDGDIDLYVCVDYPSNYFSADADLASIGGASNRVYHDANAAGRNSLYRNDIRDDLWRFDEVTDRVGLDTNNRRFSLAAAWDDYDNDGDQDLYVANDFGRNNLYQNQLRETGEATFIDIAASANAEDSASGMSVDWGDFDGDGKDDLYVANMFSAAGGRITYQPEFQPDASEMARTRLRRFARGNTLLRNQADAFEDISESAGVTVGRWAWSSKFADVNNDGWQDLVVANGYITADDTGDL